MIGVYFSGTGNTRFCVEYFVNLLEEKAVCYSIEQKETITAIDESDTIVLGYPIYYSNLPKIMRDFLTDNQGIWQGKQVYLIATMGLFSGDGTGVAARMLKKYGAIVTGGIHLKMPDCIADEKMLKRPLDENRELVQKAREKMNQAAIEYKEGRPIKEGLNMWYHLAGLFGQRLYFGHKTWQYTDKLRINKNQCVGCGMCVAVCPMQNLKMKEKKAVAGGRCTMCYRCIANCPKQAITLLGKEVVEQSRVEKYL